MMDTEQANPIIIKRMSRIMANDRLAHAYLFFGPHFSGKSETAFVLAQLINCEMNQDVQLSTPCLDCSSCIQMAKNQHPDFHLIDKEEGEHIKIEDVRALIDQTKLRPFLGKRKVFVIKNVESLTLQSANALLKTLEEPNSSSLILITTSSPEKVLATIRSRCHAVHFSADTQDGLADRLVNQYHIEHHDAHFLSYFSEGCAGKAKVLYEQNFIDFKEEVFREFIFHQDSDAFVKELIKDRNQTKVFLDILLIWIRDAILIKEHESTSRLIHSDRISELKQFSMHRTFKDILIIEQQVVETMRLLSDNLNVKLPLMIIKEMLWVK